MTISRLFFFFIILNTVMILQYLHLTDRELVYECRVLFFCLCLYGICGLRFIFVQKKIYIHTIIAQMENNLFFLSCCLFDSFRIFQFYTRFTCEDGATVGEGSSFVGLFSVQFTLVVGQWQWTTIFDQFQQSVEKIRRF